MGCDHPLRVHPVRPHHRHGHPAAHLLGHRQLLVSEP